MTVEFVDASSGEVLASAETRKAARKADKPKAEKPPRTRMNGGVSAALWIGAVLVASFVGFSAGAMGNALVTEKLKGEIAVLEVKLELLEGAE